jgi:hypothetical protein
VSADPNTPWFPWNPEGVYYQYFHEPYGYAEERLREVRSLVDSALASEDVGSADSVEGLRQALMMLHEAVGALETPDSWRAAWDEGFRRAGGLHPPDEKGCPNEP